MILGKQVTTLETVSPDDVAGPSIKKSKAESSRDNDIWMCKGCDGVWAQDGDDVWIVCDMCDTPFHLQYDREEHYELDIESIEFVCSSCILISEDDLVTEYFYSQ